MSDLLDRFSVLSTQQLSLKSTTRECFDCWLSFLNDVRSDSKLSLESEPQLADFNFFEKFTDSAETVARDFWVTAPMPDPETTNSFYFNCDLGEVLDTWDYQIPWEEKCINFESLARQAASKHSCSREQLTNEFDAFETVVDECVYDVFSEGTTEFDDLLELRGLLVAAVTIAANARTISRGIERAESCYSEIIFSLSAACEIHFSFFRVQIENVFE